MSQGITLVAADKTTNKTYTAFGLCPPGLSHEQFIGAKNNDSTAIVKPVVAFYPNQKSNTHLNTSGYPVIFSSIICQDDNGNLQKTVVAKEAADAELTKLTSRYKVLRYNGTSYTDVTEDATINMMASSSDKLYVGCNEIIPCLKMEFSTPGSYTGFAYKISQSDNTFNTPPVDATDGTSETTSDGVVDLGTVTEAEWQKCILSGFNMYWIEFSCTAVTTQAVLDVLYWEYNYQLPYVCLLGTGLYYDKTASYTPVTPYAEYCNMGRIVFDADPCASPGNTLSGAFNYKNPQPGTYLLTFSNINTTAKTANCQVNAGSDIGIRIDSVTIHENIVPGMKLIFSSGLTATDTATIEISESVKWDWYALPDGSVPGTYQNKDLELPDIAAGDIEMFYHKNIPSSTATTTKNKQSGIVFIYET